MSGTNNNQALIDGLRQAADFLEARPEFPTMNKYSNLPQALRLWADDKTQLREAAQQLGSFEKRFTDFYFSLHHAFNEAIELEVTIQREEVCKKIVTWDCSDNESLLKLVETPE